jgi:hypothetical protein
MMLGSMIEKLPHASANIVDQHSADVGADRVILRLRDHGGGRLVLERVIDRPEDVSITLLLPMYSERLFLAFSSADPWGDILAPAYDAIHVRCRHVFNGSRRLSRQVRSAGVDDVATRILECGNECDLAAVLEALAGSLGAEQYCVSWMEFDSSGNTADHRYLVGCDPAWIQKYIYRAGYMNDPLLEYSKRNATPATSSDLQGDASEHWLLQEARAHGLSTILACPVHESARSSVTVLQVAVGGNVVDGNLILSRNQHTWRGAAGALSDWRLRQLSGIATECGLIGEELTVLRALLHWKDSSAETIADELNLRARHIRQIVYPGITRKMGVSHIKDAVTLAFKCGLIN